MLKLFGTSMLLLIAISVPVELVRYYKLKSLGMSYSEYYRRKANGEDVPDL
jgi:hypothetical protein